MPDYQLTTPAQHPVITLVDINGNPADLSGYIPPGTFAGTQTGVPMVAAEVTATAAALATKAVDTAVLHLNGSETTPTAVKPRTFDVRGFGALGNTRRYASGGAMTAGSATFTYNGGITGVVPGQVIHVQGCGVAGGVLEATVLAPVVSAVTLTLSVAASTSVPNAAFVIGTDDTAAFTAAQAAAAAVNGVVGVGAGFFMFDTITYAAGVHWEFAGPDVSKLVPLHPNAPLFSGPTTGVVTTRFTGGASIWSHLGGSTGAAFLVQRTDNSLFIGPWDYKSSGGGVGNQYSHLFKLDGAARCYNNRVEGPKTYQQYGPTKSLVKCANQANINTISGPSVDGNMATGPMDYAIDASESVRVKVEHFLFQGSTFAGALFYMGEMTTLDHGWVEANLKAGGGTLPVVRADPAGVVESHSTVLPYYCTVKDVNGDSGVVLTIPSQVPGWTVENSFAGATITDNDGRNVIVNASAGGGPDGTLPGIVSAYHVRTQALATRVVAAVGNYSVLASDHTVLASGTGTVTLPSAITGRQLVIKKTDSGTTTTVAPSSGTIDGAASVALTAQYQAVVLVSDGTNWFAFNTALSAALPRLRPYSMPTEAIAENFSRRGASMVNLATTVFGTGRMTLVAVDLFQGQVVTGIKWFTGATALTRGTDPNSSHLWVALYKPSRALAGQSADDTTTAFGANSVISKNLATPYTVETSGVHYAAMMIELGTGGAPAMPSTVGVGTNTSGVLLFVTPVVCYSDTVNTGLTTTAPPTVAAATSPMVVASIPYCEVLA